MSKMLRIRKDALVRPQGVFTASEGLSLHLLPKKTPKTIKKTLRWNIIDSLKYSKYQGALLWFLLPKITEVFEYAVPPFCRIYARRTQTKVDFIYTFWYSLLSASSILE